MSDISQGENWWQASDHKWYPPEQHPDLQAPPELPAPEPEPEPPVMSAPVVSPPQATAPMPSAPPPTAPSAAASAGNGKWIVVGVLAVAVAGLGAFLVFGRDDGKKNTVAVSPSTTASSSSTNSSSSSSSSQLTDTQLQARMLIATDLGTTFKDGTFAVDSTTPTPCGQDNLNVQVPPTSDLGSQASDATAKAFFREELSVYKDTATAARAFSLGKQGFACTQGTTANGQTFTFSPAGDVSFDLGVPNALAIEDQIGATTGDLIAVQSDNRILSFQFEAPSSANKSALPNALTIAKQGIAKLKS